MNTMFAETLRKLRKEKGLSQSQLSSQMFVNKSTIARWENGTRLPDAATMLQAKHSPSHLHAEWIWKMVRNQIGISICANTAYHMRGEVIMHSRG